MLKGESLFNDATALLLFGGALTVLSSGGFRFSIGVRLGLAVPGGLLLGMVCAYLARYVNRLVKGTLGGNLLQFVLAYLVWIIADQLHLSAVLCVIAFAMTLARTMDASALDARMRVHSFAVWSSVVFTLNVFAFLLMGMQARSIVGRMQASHLREAAGIRRPHCARGCMHAFGRRHRLQSSGGMVGVVTQQACARHGRPGFVRRLVRYARVRYHGHGVRSARVFPAT